MSPKARHARRRDTPNPVSRVVTSPLLRVLTSRILSAIPVLVAVSFLTYVTMNALPGDTPKGPTCNLPPLPPHFHPPPHFHLPPGALKFIHFCAELAAQNHQSVFVRYWHWLWPILAHHNFGISNSSGQAVTNQIALRLPVTAELAGFALVLSIVLAIPAGLLAARRPSGIIDHVSRVVSMGGFSIPAFVIALLLVLVFSADLDVLPAIGFVPLSQSVEQNLRSLLMPAIAIGFSGFCVYSRFLRADVIEQMLGQDYVLTAKAKGAGPWRLLIRHATRNSVLGFMTLIGVNLGALISGAVVIEQIFALPGIGQGLLLAVTDRDNVLVEGFVLVFAVIVILVNLVIDLLYAILDPRIRYGAGT
ncbi:MAG: ABC transporter permease [Acidimicrobiales bacterium]